MSMDLKDEIRRSIQEEQAGSDAYMKLSEMAHGHAKGVLRDIAHEEETHMKLLKEMLNNV